MTCKIADKDQLISKLTEALKFEHTALIRLQTGSDYRIRTESVYHEEVCFICDRLKKVELPCPYCIDEPHVQPVLMSRASTIQGTSRWRICNERRVGGRLDMTPPTIAQIAEALTCLAETTTHIHAPTDGFVDECRPCMGGKMDALSTLDDYGPALARAVVDLLRAADYEMNERDDWCTTHSAAARRDRFHSERCSVAINTRQGCVITHPDLSQALATAVELLSPLVEAACPACVDEPCIDHTKL